MADREPSPPETVESLLSAARERLRGSPHGIPSREAALLLARTLDRDEAWLYAFPESPVGATEADLYQRRIAHRLTGEPVAYILNEREFWGRTFKVDSRVLIPRPETEHLIDTALALDLPAAPRILDLGTGSGAIAITLALEIPNATVFAVDLSLSALANARENVDRLGAAERVRLLGGDLARSLSLETFDLVVSNPPYIAEAALPELQRDVTAFEPRLALVASQNGTATLARLATEMRSLAPEIPILVEIGHDQEAIVRQLFEPGFDILRIARDLAGHPRLLVARRRKAP